MPDLPENPTGAQLVDALRAAAAQAGLPVGGFLLRHRVTDQPARYLKQLAAAKYPRQRTTDIVRRICAAGGIPEPVERNPRGAGRKRGNVQPSDPVNIDAMRASSAARLARSRMAHAPDARGRKGEELMIPADIWLALDAEARARGATSAALFHDVLRTGLFTLAEDRFEESQKEKG